MLNLVKTHSRVLFSALVLISGLASVSSGQEPRTTAAPSPDDVIRVDTDLVETQVRVFDKQNRFVHGLSSNQFELRIDDKVVPIAFFEQVVSAKSLQRITSQNNSASPDISNTPLTGQDVRDRTVFFFIDDLHLSLDSLNRTRLALSHFLDNEMVRGDRAAIITASGQVGFLQQLTDNKAVLRAALSSLTHKAYTVVDTEVPSMTEYMALKIERRDRDANSYYIGRCMKENPGYTPGKCAEVVLHRARRVLQQASAITAQTLSSLEKLTSAVERLRGRKLILLISDGFFLGARDIYATAFDKVPLITDRTRRSGAVIYSIDARGLFSGEADALTRLVDGNGVLDRANVGETPASQDALNALAVDTGGRAMRNSNSISRWVTDTLTETSNYYLIAWRPTEAEQKSRKFKHFDVTIAGRPDLQVRLHRTYVPKLVAESKKEAASNPSPSIVAADTPLPTRYGIPTFLAARYIDVPGTGPVIAASIQIESAHLQYGRERKQTAIVDVAGVVLNKSGKQVGAFQTQLNIQPQGNDSTSDSQTVIYNHRLPIAPGLYQVRVGARDKSGGQAGSASQWIEIPDLGSKQLTLSSVHLGGTIVTGQSSSKSTTTVQFSVDNHFSQKSPLDLLVFVYNARPAVGRQEFSLTTKIQILNKEGGIVIGCPLRVLKPDNASDSSRIPYRDIITLQTLAPGEYVLRLSVTDLIAQTTATQEVEFTSH